MAADDQSNEQETPEEINPNQINLIEDTSPQKTTPSSKAFAVAAIIAGLLVIATGYIVYRYFDIANQIENTELATVDTVEEEDKSQDKEGITTEDFIATDFLDISGNQKPDSSGITQEKPETQPQPTPEVLGETKPKVQEITPDTSGIENNDSEGIIWTANRYTFGDITGNTHKVIWGDTLWEISKGKYGTPHKWINIADTNKVPYLSNGHPLIIPEQVLDLP